MPKTSDKPRLINCPECGRTIAWDKDNPYRPFCSERCKLIDLGAWASERYRIAAEEENKPEDPG